MPTSMAASKLPHLLSFDLSTAIHVLKNLLSHLATLHRTPFLVTLVDIFLSLYFWSCGLTPCAVDLDDGQTTIHFWGSAHRRSKKPYLVLIHGYGGNSRWQFLAQVGPLSRSFNVFMPDLLFFGKSHTLGPQRSDVFQATCIVEGLKKLGVDKYSIYAISYGGFVGYRMAEIGADGVEKVVIVSSGIACTDEQKFEQLRKIGRNPLEFLLPEKPQDLRVLVNLSIYKFNPLKWVPNFFLQQFIDVMCSNYREEKSELAEYLLFGKEDSKLPVLTQETLIIWGDQDKVFPLSFAHHLQKHLGPKSKLEIINDTGHAANVESPGAVNNFIRAFILGK
ncbi:lipase 3 [Rhodamnia argentea]|uniref:Lipase 3 n=1 Tax=Rhodamnia argentea TaxID=178133 RepID=A0A8B8NUQ7_9MYRT|nr:lipase 3 [Rhodamnia argentea]